MNYHVPTTGECAVALERLARRIAPAVALVVALAVHTYWAGYRVGRAVHQLSDWLAHHWPTRPAQQRSSAPAPQQTSIAAPQQDALTAHIHLLRAQQLSQRRIAEICGCSRATVRRRLMAA